MYLKTLTQPQPAFSNDVATEKPDFGAIAAIFAISVYSHKSIYNRIVYHITLDWQSEEYLAISHNSNTWTKNF